MAVQAARVILRLNGVRNGQLEASAASSSAALHTSQRQAQPLRDIHGLNPKDRIVGGDALELGK